MAYTERLYPKESTFFRLEIDERVRISKVKVDERVEIFVNVFSIVTVVLYNFDLSCVTCVCIVFRHAHYRRRGIKHGSFMAVLS